MITLSTLSQEIIKSVSSWRYEARQLCFSFESAYLLYERQYQYFKFRLNFFVMFENVICHIFLKVLVKNHAYKIEAEIQDFGTSICRRRYANYNKKQSYLISKLQQELDLEKNIFFGESLSKFYMPCGRAKLCTLRYNATDFTIYVYYNVTIRNAYYKISVYTSRKKKTVHQSKSTATNKAKLLV